MSVPIVVKLNFHIILVNLDFVHLVEINTLENVLKLSFKNAITVNIDILCLPFLIIFGLILEKIGNF